MFDDIKQIITETVGETLGTPAVYHPKSGGDINVNVIFDRSAVDYDTEHGSVRGIEETAEIAAHLLPTPPEQEDQITIKGNIFTVMDHVPKGDAIYILHLREIL